MNKLSQSRMGIYICLLVLSSVNKIFDQMMRASDLILLQWKRRKFGVLLQVLVLKFLFLSDIIVCLLISENFLSIQQYNN